MKVKYYDLQNKKVFITGGGSGIGASIVEHFCEQGSEVYFVDKNVNFSHITEEIKKITPKYLRDVQVFDIYQEDNSCRKSIALRFIFRHKGRNLTDEEVGESLVLINKQLLSSLNVTAR